MALKISIIIPVLNEADLLLRQLQSLQAYRAQGHELIVVDGGSSDRSLDVAAGLADISCATAPGRSVQMNQGASLASGQVLLFLHVDTVLPAASMTLIETVLASSKSDWGRFDVRLSNTRVAYRLISAMMNIRSALSGVCTGDQALFIRRELFEQIGGFANIPLMEDVEISKRLRAICHPLRIKAPVITSSRRWEQNGMAKTIVLMWLLRLRYFLGADPQRLADIYYPRRTHKNSATGYQYPNARIIIFAREPVPGKVKTRLFPAIGEERALSLHCAMIRRITKMVESSKLAPMRLAVSSNIHHKVFLSCCNIENIILQSPGDLGQKMAHAVESTLADKQVNSVLLIGADCPSIDATYLESALSQLAAGTKAVLGPAQDGGYVLLGLASVVPALFNDMPWGTETVLAKSIQRLQAEGISYSLLETRWDVDRPDDLALLAELRPAIDY